MACNCTNNCGCGHSPIQTTQGVQGDQGDKGDKGDQGDQGIQGIQGDQGDVGGQGDPGNDGLGWTGGSYDPPSGIVTFTSDDGLEFATGDLRGEDGDDGPQGPAGGGVTETTYSDLVTLIDNDSLVPGSWYKFPYETIHSIGGPTSNYNNTTTTFDDGTAVLSTFTPETENLMVHALTDNTLHVLAKSCEYPRDIIHYNYGLDLTEDGLVNRPGFITYREDTDLQLSAFFDFRNVLHRRWDMDSTESPARDADFAVMTAHHSASDIVYNHPIAYVANSAVGDMIPAFANFDDGGNSTIGAMTTANVGTFRDFKTFVGLDFDLYASPVESARFKNIHIKESSDVARLEGSGAGVPVSPGNVVTDSKYSFGNVVFFTRSAEDVIIGRNASGITFTGKTIKNVDIGDNNENIIIGGSFAVPDYTTPGVPELSNFNEYIKIGNSNRNVSFGSNQRNIEIGNSNISTTFNGTSGNVKIGSYNNITYMHYVGNIDIGDFCKEIRISGTNDLTIENSCQVIDLVNCGGNAASFQYSWDSLYAQGTYVDGFGQQLLANGTEPPAANNPEKFIGTRCSNIYAQGSSSFRLLSQCKKIHLRRCAGLEFGASVVNAAIVRCLGVTVGAGTQSVEVLGSDNLSIGKGCTGVKVVASNGSTTIGDNTSNTMVYGGSSNVSIGAGCQNVYLSGSNNNFITTIGNYCVNIIARASGNLSIGEYNSDVFLEQSQNCKIGDNNSNISLTDIGIIFKPGFPNFSDFHFIIDADSEGKGISQTITPSGATLVKYIPANGPLDYANIDWTPSMSAWVDAVAPGSTESRPGSSNCIIGSNNNEVFIVGSAGCTVDDNCSNIVFGSNASSANAYTLGSDPVTGIMNSIDMVTVNATVVDEGEGCENNSIGSRCTNIKLRGIGKTNNAFADNVTNVVAVPAYLFQSNRVDVNGNSLILTASHVNKVYDMADINGNRWEMTISLAGALPANGTQLI